MRLHIPGRTDSYRPLLSNTSATHYNGIDTQQAYDFTGAAASAELVQAAATGVAAFAMLMVGIDGNNYYRLFVRNNARRAAENRRDQE